MKTLQVISQIFTSDFILAPLLQLGIVIGLRCTPLHLGYGSLYEIYRGDLGGFYGWFYFWPALSSSISQKNGFYSILNHSQALLFLFPEQVKGFTFPYLNEDTSQLVAQSRFLANLPRMASFWLSWFHWEITEIFIYIVKPAETEEDKEEWRGNGGIAIYSGHGPC